MFALSIVQRCQWHKRENVVRCLPKAQAAAWRRWLQQAYERPTYAEFRTALGQLTDKVDHWRTADQKHRWVASALLLIEPRLRRIKGYRHLPLLRAALQTEIGRTEKTKVIAVA